MDDIKWQVGKFVPEKYQIDGTSLHSDTEGVMHTKRARELLALSHITANLPPDMDGMLRGIVRNLILPTMEGLIDFNWDKAVSEIKAYEKKVGQFEKKKPAAAANTAGTKTKEKPFKKNSSLTRRERHNQT